MVSPVKFSIFIKTSIYLVGIVAFVWMLFIGQSIIVPLLFATFIAVLLHPVVDLMVRKKINRIVAITITLILSFALIAAFSIFLYVQISQFSDSWPIIVEKFTVLIDQSTRWISEYFNIKPEKITAWITESKNDMMSNGNSAIGSTLMSFGSSLVVLFIIPVYIFMILYYQPLLIEFLNQLFGKERQTQVRVVISKIKNVIQRYLVGLVLEALIVAILNTAGLLMLGIDYAILLGVIGALLNVIPYIGGIVGVALPMMIALVTENSPWYAVYVLVIYYIIQLIDNNFIVPKIVASKVKINALVSIVVILAFGALWGVAGMFISIPLTAILKVIFDHVESLKPWGYLLGDTMPVPNFLKIKIPIKIPIKISRKKKS